MTRHLTLTLALAAATLVVAYFSGQRRSALVGAGSASLAAVASLLFVQRTASARRPVHAAVAVMAVMFLVRILLVALGTALVVRAGESVIAFVLFFFVPYFVFAAIEGWYVASLNRGPGTPV